MKIKPMIRSNICINAHPIGCAKETLNQIEYARTQKEKRGIKSIQEGSKGPQTVLVLGCSTGYGLASRISAAFMYGADTLGVSFEKEATEKKAGTPGWYNNLAFDTEAKKCGLKSETLNADAFSDECRKSVIEVLKSWGKKADLVIYSLASPVRTDPETGVLYKSALKPIGQVYAGDSLDMMTGKITQASTDPAEGDDIANTVKVMGGEDWQRWINQLKAADVLAEGCRTVAYSYIGPELSHPIYRNGTIGEAKKDLEQKANEIDSSLKDLNGSAFVSVNKGVVTRSSSVIPIIAEYLAVLFKVMKDCNKHEGCIEQMVRMFAERLYTGENFAAGEVPVDEKNRIRMDDWELEEEIQNEVNRIMPQITEENVEQLTDLAGIRHDFLAINGFDVPGVDYELEVEDMSKIQ